MTSTSLQLPPSGHRDNPAAPVFDQDEHAAVLCLAAAGMFGHFQNANVGDVPIDHNLPVLKLNRLVALEPLRVLGPVADGSCCDS